MPHCKRRSGPRTLVPCQEKQQTSAPTVSTNSKVVSLQVIASLGADVELGDVTGAFLESAELSGPGGKLFLRQLSGGLPGLHPSTTSGNTFTVVWFE